MLATKHNDKWVIYLAQQFILPKKQLSYISQNDISNLMYLA
jgi:hypothetical protein